jgi:RNA polymerase sigma factor (sigma-70 family)
MNKERAMTSQKKYGHTEYFRHAFDNYCKKALKYGGRDIMRNAKRKSQFEVSFDELPKSEQESLYTEDEYFANEYIFNVLGVEVEVTDGALGEALAAIESGKRDIILLSYFMDMSDREIAEKYGILRRTVARYRKKTLELLRKLMEV